MRHQRTTRTANKRYPIKPRFAMANAKAAELLRSIGNPNPPIPLDRLCDLNGWKVVHTELFGSDGQLMKVPHAGSNHFVIFIASDMEMSEYNEEVIRRRQYYTLAHEIGHIIMHADFELESAHSFHLPQRIKDIMEVEANWLASRLLMPDYVFSSIEDLDALYLAEKCQVNFSAAQKRISGLNDRIRDRIIAGFNDGRRRDTTVVDQLDKLWKFRKVSERYCTRCAVVYRGSFTEVEDLCTSCGYPLVNIDEEGRRWKRWMQQQPER